MHRGLQIHSVQCSSWHRKVEVALSIHPGFDGNIATELLETYYFVFIGYRTCLTSIEYYFRSMQSEVVVGTSGFSYKEDLAPMILLSAYFTR